MILLEKLAQCHLISVTFTSQVFHCSRLKRQVSGYPRERVRHRTERVCGSPLQPAREKLHSCLLPSCSHHLSKPLLPAASQDLLMFKFSPCGTCKLVWDHFSLCQALQIMEKVDGEGTFRKTTVSKVFVAQVAWQGHLNCFLAWYWTLMFLAYA